MTTTDLALVTKPTGPTKPPTQPKPTRGQNIDTAGALTTLTIAISGVAHSAWQGGDLVGYPIGATFAAMVIAAVVLYRTPQRQP